MDTSTFFINSYYSGGIINTTPKDAYSVAKDGNAIIVDVREQSFTAYKQFDVPTVIYCPISTLVDNMEVIPNDIAVILADSTGIHSHEAFIILKDAGYGNIANLAGGIVEWERDGLPIKVDYMEQLDGSCTCQLKPRNRLKK
ncbi:MAG TPA: rhodanese-like domain-containing protein [Tenuifilaceae bacterium]|nr:rhodanese-like domain-containing protein [Tenuifilaceae bacterium]HPN21431.1 rhodanese-like domain-containing protein [Tenuifilaceae bacterium]HPV55974.1 rhodanese-like domain-containing protein [Tenuifilaceae bacterium]